MVVKIRYNEPKFNHHNGNIVRRVPRDWSKGIHSVKFQDLILHVAHIAIKLDIGSMNVHLLKIM
jgi:hypothetical protein